MRVAGCGLRVCRWWIWRMARRGWKGGQAGAKRDWAETWGARRATRKTQTARRQQGGPLGGHSDRVRLGAASAGQGGRWGVRESWDTRGGAGAPTKQTRRPRTRHLSGPMTAGCFLGRQAHHPTGSDVTSIDDARPGCRDITLAPLVTRCNAVWASTTDKAPAHTLSGLQVLLTPPVGYKDQTVLAPHPRPVPVSHRIPAPFPPLAVCVSYWRHWPT